MAALAWIISGPCRGSIQGIAELVCWWRGSPLRIVPPGACGPAWGFGAGAGAVRRSGWRRGLAVRVVLLVHAGFLAECLALVENQQRHLNQRGVVCGGGGGADVAF